MSSAWRIEYSASALRALKKLERQTAGRIVDYLAERVAASGRPRDLGKPLMGQLKGHWRYRVGDHRVICNIEDDRLLVLVVEVGDRKAVYR